MVSKAKKTPARPAQTSEPAPFAVGDTVQVGIGDYGNARGVVESVKGKAVGVRLGRVMLSFPVNELWLIHKATPR